MATRDAFSGSAMPLTAVTRRVVGAQMLFTAGNVLTTGGFLYYFASTLGTSPFLFALLLVTPEIAESAGVFVRPLILRFGSRKRIWIGFLIAARVLALGVPVIGLGDFAEGALRWPLLITCVALWYVCQGIAYVAYLSWLSDLVPEMRWGRFFAKRNVASLCITLAVAIPAAFARKYFLGDLDDPRWSYVVIFIAGAVLCVASIGPMLSLPNVPTRSETVRLPSLRVFLLALQSPSFRWLVLHSWWLSFAQGLTQSAFYSYRINVLGISLETFYTMLGLMLSLQVAWTFVAGVLSDRIGDKWPRFFSLLAASGAMLFWLTAAPDSWWLLYGAYFAWGLFGVANLCGQNLLLRLAPSSDNSLHVGLYRQVGGLLAGLAGLLGGFWLNHLLEASSQIVLAGLVLGPYQIIFAVSFLGRLTAPLWLLPIPNRPGHSPARSG